MSSTTEGPCSAGFKNNPPGTEHYANLDVSPTLLHRPWTNNILVLLMINTCACGAKYRQSESEREENTERSNAALFYFSIWGLSRRTQDSGQTGDN